MLKPAIRVDDDDRAHLLPDHRQVETQNRFIQFAADKAFRRYAYDVAVMVNPQFVNILPATPWLPSVERRITDSVVPAEYQEESTPEWLTEEVAQAAVRFFQNTADVLPGEPHLYASKTGALVAEFETPTGALTTVVSPETTILFGVRANQPNSPFEVTIRRGSNRLREDVEAVTRRIYGPHGPMGPAD